MKNLLPTSVILAITLRCNSRCLACNIWQRKQKDDMKLNIIQKLPDSLRSVDITGGEPFLHSNLVVFIKILKKTCPKAKILITTNGLLFREIKKIIPQLVKIDKNLALRVSLDGMEEIHDRMRGIKGAFEKATKSLKIIRQSGIKDLGIIFTLTKINQDEIDKVLNFCQREKFNFSLNLIHNSPIYFGQNHHYLIPDKKITKEILEKVTTFFKSPLPLNNIAKRWFYKQTNNYLRTNKRPLKCNAGSNFFYVEPSGDLYACHLKKNRIGNLKDQSFSEIWQSSIRRDYLNILKKCDDCWMICTVKDEIKNNKLKIITENFLDK